MEQKKNSFGFIIGLIISAGMGLLAKALSSLPFLSIMGQLVIAILIGMIWRAIWGIQTTWQGGIAFSSKNLLRFGIILLGVRLNLADIWNAGPKLLLLAVLNLTFAFIIVIILSKLFKIDKNTSLLTASGTAICGAAAISAISSQIQAKNQETAISITTIALLGTLFTLGYTYLAPWLGLSPANYGLFAGSTLHEIAHVVAAAAPFGKEAMNLAVTVKLTRVALLVPVAILISLFTHSTNQGQSRNWKSIQIPWFIFGFLFMSGLHTFHIIPETWVDPILLVSYFFMATAMASLGLNVDIKEIRRVGKKTMLVGLIGSIFLSIFGYYFIVLLS
ncbi:YeiH family protein [Thermoflavimicrobium daqui]|jgi:uncharacterized integral membrane protein (TIGR00698 family)|uniref:Putative sulfate exporter family transporter n=1 Tax=Thermoflavimicrobium daqui TaxID=2137476 RepID=A0A364K226_9BACL|nr:YeiH family protein [Thermoflavimicrobium daqui]RAL22067.1 putative sulfate exporter family transporter [Thermoflavimicrobium daqui]